MTINIAIAVSEGLVMAADSLSQMTDNRGRVHSLHQSVEKITEIRGRSLAVMINGTGELKKRTVISLIREFEFTEYKNDPAKFKELSVSGFASNLMAFIKQRYEDHVECVDEAKRDDEHLGIIVGGYSPSTFFPEVYVIQFPEGTFRKVYGDGDGSSTIKCWGMTQAVDRVVDGFDKNLLYVKLKHKQFAQAVKDAGLDADKESDEKLNAILAGIHVDPSLIYDVDALDLRMQHRLEGMPLFEAVEFAEFLGNVAIGYDRFSMGLPSVGGHLDVVAMQPDGLHWYTRKPFVKEMAAARDRAFSSDESDRTRLQMLKFMEDLSKMNPLDSNTIESMKKSITSFLRGVPPPKDGSD